MQGTWVLLRGLTRESRHWGDFLARMQAAFPADGVLALDLPGNGGLHKEKSPIKVAGFVEHCRAELAQREVRTPVRLLAMSLGAMVAVDWASRYPGEIGGAALINTSLRGFSPFFRRLRPSVYPAIARQLLRRRASPATEKTVLRLTTRHPPSAEHTLADWQAYRMQNPVALRNGLRQLLAAARFRAPEAAPGCPLLILASEKDGLVDARCSRTLARQWSAPLAMHPSAGHDIPLDDPDWVVARLREWAGPDY